MSNRFPNAATGQALGLLLAAVLCTQGCTTRKAITRPSPGTIVEKVELGDNIRVQVKNGKTYELEVIEVGDTFLRGYDAQTRKRYRVPLSQVVRMEYEEISAGKTAAAAGAGTVIIYAGIVLVVAAALDAIGDSFGESFDNFFSGGC